MPQRAARLVPSAVPRAVAVAVLVVAGSLATPAGADEGVSYRSPVDAPVSDPFRPPARTYGPGNRGLTYDLAPGTAVHAAADGEVVFAGAVAGTLHVTVLHADGLRTSYSFLSGVSAQRGQSVRQGDVVGIAGPGFHLGARDGDAYLDPAGLFDPHILSVRLVPHTEPLPPTDAGLLREQASLRALVLAEQPGPLRRLWNRVAAYGAPAADALFRTVDAAWHTWQQLTPTSVVGGILGSLARHLLQDCTPSSVAFEAPAEERVALLVAGLGSTSEHASIDDVDVAALGYEPADVIRYRYGGGRTPEPTALDPALAAITAAPYDETDTLGDITERARELADLVQEVAAARPGVPIDLYAHSLGGVVTRVALLELAGRPGGLDDLGQVVTIGAPHRGADLATVAVLAEKGFAQDVHHIRERYDIPIDPWSPAVRQLAETSPVIDRLHAEGVPEGVDLRTVAARGDLVVTADKAHVPGHPAAIIDLAGLDAHADITGHPDTTRELQLGLAGLAPACQGILDAVADAVVPEVISGASDAAGLVSVIPS